MTTKINKKRAIELLQNAVQLKGKDYVDPGAADGNCVYSDGEVPRCIVGHALAEVGAPLDELANLEGTVAEFFGPDPVQATDLDIEMTKGAVNAFAKAQRIQDHAGTWGTALKEAKKAAK
jgi:hypothetical protein